MAAHDAASILHPNTQRATPLERGPMNFDRALDETLAWVMREGLLAA